MNDDGRVEVKFDPFLGTLGISLGENRQLTLDGMPAETHFVYAGEAEIDQHPLWLSHEEADVLSKMVNYILERVKVSEQATEVLSALQPRIEEVRDTAAERG